MAGALAVRNGEAAPAIATPIDAATLERVVCDGDLSRLTPDQKVQWYRARCEAAGLDPRTQPFQYLNLKGKLTLYATKAATDQLIGAHKLTVEILDRTHHKDLNVYEVRCRVTFPDGRHVEDMSALPIGGLKGDDLANALMKSVTKAKRRTVLSACGLGMLDETELDTIPGAERVTPSHHATNHDNNTGHGSGAYARPESVNEFKAWLGEFVDSVNAKWLDKHTDPHGNVTDGVKAELLSTFQVAGHLLKWAVSEGMVNAPDDARPGQRDKFVAVAWERNRSAVTEEAGDYGRRKWREELAVMKAREATPADDSDPDTDYPPEPGSGG